MLFSGCLWQFIREKQAEELGALEQSLREAQADARSKGEECAAAKDALMAEQQSVAAGEEARITLANEASPPRA